MSTRQFGTDETHRNPFFPRMLGTHGAVTAEHYLAAQVGADLLKAGGNAVDAAVAATFVEGVVNPNMHTVGGECPMLIHMAGSGKVVSVNGNMAAPELATPRAFRERGLDAVPWEGILAAGVPAAFGALLTALLRFGTFTFGEVASPAMQLAREGFPVHKGLIRQLRYGLAALEEKFRGQWPGSAQVYLPRGKLPQEGQIIKNPALADMFHALAAAEKSSSGGREGGLQAVLDMFYRGDVATEIDRYSQAHDGLLRRSDLERFETRLEEPVSLDYRGARVFKCGPWNQGPVMLQGLAILENFDLRAMGHHSADYLHTVVEAMKLAYADREQYYGDPEQVRVPIAGLLSKDYGKLRAQLIDMGTAHPELRPGDPEGGAALLPADQRLGGKAWGPGTVHVDVIDSAGNMVACTPSGAWIRSAEVMPGLGFPLGNRMQTFYLEPAHHPNLVAPCKRPRTTISPSMVFKGDQPWLVFGSMGGDQQDQWQLQFLLNMLEFGMTLQEAIEAPKFSSEHFPEFFYPHGFDLNRLRIEPRVDEQVLRELARRGHDLEIAGDWSEGYLLAAARDAATGLLEAGCDLRAEKSEVFPSFALCW
ncbi:MAG: gamma-glutamyltransferase family protein [SAR324 cluster bacterium]|nr:gamma-glutamyltransferase family protein [SAR324 cluster bacterium]